MKRFKLNKKGSAKGMIMWAVGLMILINSLIFVFGSDGLANSNWTANVPTIMQVIFPLLILVGAIGYVIKSR